MLPLPAPVSCAGSSGRPSQRRSRSSSCAGVNNPRHVTLPPSIKIGEMSILLLSVEISFSGREEQGRRITETLPSHFAFMHSGNGLKSQFDIARPEQIGQPLVGLMQHILIAHHKMQQLQVLFQCFGMLGDIPGYCYELAVPLALDAGAHGHEPAAISVSRWMQPT